MCYKVYKEVWEMMDSPVYNLGVLTWYIDTVIKSKSCCGNKGRWRPLLWLGMDTLIVNRKSEIGEYSSHGERKLCKVAMCSCWKSFSYLKPAFTFQNDALGKQTDRQTAVGTQVTPSAFTAMPCPCAGWLVSSSFLCQLCRDN